MAEPGLFIRAGLDESGGASIEPIYAVTHVPIAEPPFSEYSFTLLDSKGEVISSRPAAVVTAEEPTLRIRSLYASFPLPDARVASVRLDKMGMLLEQRQLAPAKGVATARLALSASGNMTVLTWEQVDTPALIRFTSDDGKTWTTIGFDVLGGELMMDRQTVPVKNGRFEIVLADETRAGATVIPFNPSG